MAEKARSVEQAGVYHRLAHGGPGVFRGRNHRQPHVDRALADQRHGVFDRRRARLDEQVLMQGAKLVLNFQRGREVLEHVSATGKSPRAIVDGLGLAQVSDSSALEQAVRDVLAANPAAVADYQSGKVTAINFLKGQVMKSTRGKANQAVVEDLLKQNLAQ